MSAEPDTGVKPRVLFVDDDKNVLDAIALNLRRQYDVITSQRGADALEVLAKDPTISVVISDMRMPEMNGASFLKRAREQAPAVVRMLLTGQADMPTAIAAVNQGHIFRILTKPCPKDTLATAIESALEQHRLITAERELLEQTLRGCVKTLVDVLALISPTAFGRANRIKQRTIEIAAALGLTETWQLEVAALLCQLGVVSLPHDVLEKIRRAEPLSDGEAEMLARVPAITERLLVHIPRIDVVRSILAHHVKPAPRTNTTDPQQRLIELGAHVLRVALDLDTPEATADSQKALEMLYGRGLDREVLEATKRSLQGDATAVAEIREVPVHALCVGMVLAEDVVMATGALLVPRGYEVTAGFLERMRNYPVGAVRGPVRIIRA